MPRDGSITLPDGRRLAYAEYGDPNGRPVIFLHGWPNARRVARLADDVSARNNVRLISPERPGFGQSEFQEGRAITDWPRDVLALADALGIGRFSIAGLSGGGPYAAACATQISDRLDGVAFVSSPAPLDAPRQAIGLSRLQQFAIRRLSRRPFLIRLGIWGLSRLARWWPALVLRLAGLGLGPFDRRVLGRREVRATFKDDLREAFRHGTKGPAWDLVLLMRPWGFRPEDIPMPSHLWHGTADTTVPVSMGRYLASVMPRCNARIYEDEGHLLIFERMEEIQNALLARR